MRDIWLRAVSEDFNNVETFLQKQVQMTEYNEDKRFRTEQEVGGVPFLGYQHLTIQTQPAQSYDENSLEFIFRLYDDAQHSIELPRIRYGIFEINGGKICNVGSIQDKERKRNKKLEKNRYYQRQDWIAEQKTTGLYNLTIRILKHFTNGEVIAFPFDADSYFTITIPDISKDYINGAATEQLYSAVAKIFEPLDYSIEDIYDEEKCTFDIDRVKELASHGSGLDCYILGLVNEFGIDGVEVNKYLANSYYNRGLDLGDPRCEVHF